MPKEKTKVYVLSQLDKDEYWCIESIHKSELSANMKLNKIKVEEDYDESDAERSLSVDEYTLID